MIEANEDGLAGRGLATENVSRALSKRRFERAWEELRENRDFDVVDGPDRSNHGGRSGRIDSPFCGEAVARLPTYLPCEEAEE